MRGAETEYRSTAVSDDRVPVSVVVCARNRAAVIGRCLDSVIAARAAEVIVVDGMSSDRTVEIAAARGARAVSDGGAGLGAARQLGARLARFEQVVFVDTDAAVAADTLEALLEEAQANGYDAIQARLLPLAARPSYWQRGESWRRQLQERPGPASALGCQATLVRRRLVVDVGFDRLFEGAAEDGDFFFRSRAAGAKIAHSATAVAYHEDRRGLAAFVGQRIWHGRGLARMLVRHRGGYTSGAAEQASTVRVGARLNLRYAPFMLVSVAGLSIGMMLEALTIALRPALRMALAQPPEGRGGASAMR